MFNNFFLKPSFAHAPKLRELKAIRSHWSLEFTCAFQPHLCWKLDFEIALARVCFDISFGRRRSVPQCPDERKWEVGTQFQNVRTKSLSALTRLLLIPKVLYSKWPRTARPGWLKILTCNLLRFSSGGLRGLSADPCFHHRCPFKSLYFVSSSRVGTMHSLKWVGDLSAPAHTQNIKVKNNSSESQRNSNCIVLGIGVNWEKTLLQRYVGSHSIVWCFLHGWNY